MNCNDNIVYTKPLGLAKLNIIDSFIGRSNRRIQIMTQRITIITHAKLSAQP
jgi:hypothetical protein